MSAPFIKRVVYLVRHGETEWNALGRFQGQLDSPLTCRGREQADKLGRILAAQLQPSGSKMHVSPLGRARETASLLRRRFACNEPVIEPRLQEVTLGSWDGLDRFEIDAEWPGALDGATPFDWYFRSPDGETFEQACDRLRDWLRSLPDGEQGPVIAVSHGLTGRLLRGVYLGLRREEALALPVPQDAVFKLAGGIVETLTLPMAAC